MTKKKNKEVYELYQIDWIDAATSSGWQDVDRNYDKDPDWTVSTVGWLIKKTKKYYILATSLSNHHVSGDRWFIPVKWTQKVSKIAGRSYTYV